MSESNVGVRATVWADRDRERMERLRELLPAVLETTHSEWQARVDKGSSLRPAEYMPHAQLHVVLATRYARVSEVTPEGVLRTVSRSTGEQRTYLVTTEYGEYRAAGEAVRRYLAAECPGTEWAVASVLGQLVIDGRTREVRR